MFFLGLSMFHVPSILNWGIYIYNIYIYIYIKKRFFLGLSMQH